MGSDRTRCGDCGVSVKKGVGAILVRLQSTRSCEEHSCGCQWIHGLMQGRSGQRRKRVFRPQLAKGLVGRVRGADQILVSQCVARRRSGSCSGRDSLPHMSPCDGSESDHTWSLRQEAYVDMYARCR